MNQQERAIIEFARNLVLSTGRALREKRKGGSALPENLVHQKTGHSDIVTDHDIWVQERMAEQIGERYPAHHIVSEEGLSQSLDAEICWILDPIDGTTNYCALGDGYAISLGIFKEGRPFYGLVLDVEAQRMYEGQALPQPPAEGRPASDGILHMGFKTMQDLARMGADPYQLAAAFRGVRYAGCASLELCGIAQGRADCYVNTHLKLWDFAAAWAILKSSGCHLRKAQNREGQYIVCAYRSEAVYAVLPEPLKKRLEGKGDE